MAIDQFKPEIFAKKIEQELEKKMVFAAHSNREYEGEVRQAGDSVRILELARPTITTSSDGAPITLSSFEELQSAAQTMQVLQQAYFGQILHDIDKRQGVEGIVEKIMTGGAYGLANAMDVHIATVASGATKMAAAAYQLTSSNALEKIDDALQALYTNNVPFNEDVELVVTPRAYMLIKRALIGSDTDNSDLLKRGIAAMYGNVAIKVSNNIVTADAGATDLCVMRTKRAVAFIQQINQVKSGDSELNFGTYFKGLALYQAQLVQPKEIRILNVKYTA